MKYLIIGKGMVGNRFAQLLHNQKTSFRILSRSEFDYTKPGALCSFLIRNKPDFLINAAGFTGKPNVDACEFDREACYFGNVVLPTIIAEACEKTNTVWGHVSSGCIYSGNSEDGTGFKEEDTPNFSFESGICSYYSGTKALAEKYLSTFPNVYIWRLRIPFDATLNPRNYLQKLLNYDILLDARNSISQLDEFVESCLKCFQKTVPIGTYNLTNPGSITTRDVLDEMKSAGLVNKPTCFFRSEEEFMKKVALAPRSNCVLNTHKSYVAGISMTPVRTALKHTISKIINLKDNHESFINRSSGVHRKQLCA